ncbi:MAG: hypothetical protein ACXVRW_03925, partial [Solirubrobacteraceae bacterium]
MSVRGASRPRPWLLGALLIAVVLIFPIARARAAVTAKPPRRSDVAAARHVVAILTRYYEAGLATRREARADVNASIAQIKGSCPHSVPNSLLRGTSTQRNIWMQLFSEASDDVAIAAIQPLGDAGATEARGLDRVRFSRRVVNRGLRQLS